MNDAKNILPPIWKTRLIVGASALGLTGLTAFFVNKWLKTLRSRREQQGSFSLGSEATVAKQIKLAFENNGFWGTDVTSLRQIFISIPSLEFFERVKKSYSRLYNSILIQDLSDELQSSEYNEFLSIIASKTGNTIDPHKLWASRLKAAFDKRYGWFPGTDEDAIVAVFIEIPTMMDYHKVEQVYFQSYGETLEDSLDDELNYFDKSNLDEILEAKP